MPDKVPTSSSPTLANTVVWGVVSVMLGVVVVRVVGRAATELPSLFQGFGTDVPAITTFALDWWYVLAVMPVLAEAVGVVSAIRWNVPGARQAAVKTLKQLSIASVALGALVLIALYVGVYAIGAVV